MITQGGIVYDKYENGYAAINFTSDLGSNVEIPDAINSLPVLKISRRAFQGFKVLKSLKLPKQLKIIEEIAFDYCGITGIVEIPDPVESIGNCAFSSNQVSSYKVGKGLQYIGYGVFGDNPTLASIIVSEENPFFCSFNNALYDKSMTKLICIPPQLNYTFPPTVVSLETRSIQINNIDTLFIPATVSYIKFDSIFRVPSLKTIHILGNLKSLDPNFVFHDIKTVQRIFYHGSEAVKGDITSVSSLINTIIYVCNEYRGSLFASKPIERFGNCALSNINNICYTIKRKTLSLDQGYILCLLISK